MLLKIFKVVSEVCGGPVGSLVLPESLLRVSRPWMCGFEGGIGPAFAYSCQAHVACDTRSAALPQEDRDRRSILLGVRLVLSAWLPRK